MLRSPDTLRLLLAVFGEFMKVRNHTVLWDAELAWYSPSIIRQICRGREDDEPNWTVRCQVRLILSKCYSLDLIYREGEKPHWTEMPSSPDTLPVLLSGFASIAWGTLSESTLLGLPNLAWSSRFFRSEQNSWTIWLQSYDQLRLHEKCFFFRLLRCYDPIWTRKACADFKSHTEWSNVQRNSAPTTTILPTLVVSFHSFNYFGHMIYWR